MEKSSVTGIVEIKKCGFNARPKLMSGPGRDDDSTVDVLPDLFKAFEGKMVRVTVETVRE